MSAIANLKCDFSKLKYEQLLSDKYFVETCFSKKYSSYIPKQQVSDMLMEITSEADKDYSSTAEAVTIDC